jgi:hypothetical protein
MVESRFDEAVQTAWGKFESKLERRLQRIGERSLGIEVEAETTGSGAAPYVQFAGQDDWLRGEVSSNRFLDEACRLGPVQEQALTALGWRRPDDEHPNWWVDVERDRLEELVSMSAGALRQALGVVHPKFLRWQRALLEERSGEDGGSVPEIGFPSTREELRELVEATVAHHLGVEELVTDDDGDIPIESGRVPLWVQVLEESPTVRILSNVVVRVMSTRQARIEADVLNRQHSHLRFTVHDRTVVATIDIPGSPFVAQHLRDMVDVAASTLNRLVDDLVLRTRGRLFLDADASGPRRDAR